MNLRFSTCVAFVLLLAGCEPVDVGHSPPPSGEAIPADTANAKEIDGTVARWGDVEQAIAAHQGKVVVVDLWSTTCAPCRREFPGLVKLHQENGDNVACISVSLDYYGDQTEPPESFRPAVTDFLTAQDADFENFICSDASDEVLSNLGAAAVPVVLVYDRNGELQKIFEDDGTYGDEGFTYEQHIAPLVAQMLDGAAPTSATQ